MLDCGMTTCPPVPGDAGQGLTFGTRIAPAEGCDGVASLLLTWAWAVPIIRKTPANTFAEFKSMII